MDAIKVLGDLLGNGRIARGQGKAILEKIMGGAGVSGQRPQLQPRNHAPAHPHGNVQRQSHGQTSALGGLMRAAVNQYGRHLTIKAKPQQAQREHSDHHRQKHDHQHQQADHNRQEQELRQLEARRRQLEVDEARVQRQHQLEEQRHAREEQRHHREEQRHAHGRPALDAGPCRFPDNREAANFQAQLMIRSMIYAGKADGCLDQKEQNEILSHMGHLSPQERQFLQFEFNRKITICDFAREVPAGLEDEVYTVALASIDLDTNQEARYLHELSHELELSHDVVNYIHRQLGAPMLRA